MGIKKFMQENYKHFNAAVCVDAAEGWIKLLQNKGKMLVTLAGAMSTAEIGISLAEMIRQEKVHAISCTGANLEEDIFNLVAHNEYKRIPKYRTLSAEDETHLRDNGFNRVTDTCIPEEAAMRRVERVLMTIWEKAEATSKRMFPYECMYEYLDTPGISDLFQIDPKNSWLIAAKEKNMPIFVPGWEDSTLGNVLVARYIHGKIKNLNSIKNGLETMAALIEWYKELSAKSPVGFFQVGGGIAGDFPICVVPLIQQDLKEDCPLWSYFAQISDSTTSFGSYSGAVPNEKISWGKLDTDTPSFIIESDASIVAPLIFNYVLGR